MAIPQHSTWVTRQSLPSSRLAGAVRSDSPLIESLSVSLETCTILATMALRTGDLQETANMQMVITNTWSVQLLPAIEPCSAWSEVYRGWNRKHVSLERLYITLGIIMLHSYCRSLKIKAYFHLYTASLTIPSIALVTETCRITYTLIALYHVEQNPSRFRSRDIDGEDTMPVHTSAATRWFFPRHSMCTKAYFTSISAYSVTHRLNSW